MKTFNNSNPSGDSPSTQQDYLNQNITPAEEAGMFNNGPDAPAESISNNAVKGGAWLLGILGVFAVCLLLAWIIDLNRSPSAPLSARATTERTVKVKPQAIQASAAQQFMAKINQASAKAASDKAVRKIIVIPAKAVNVIKGTEASKSVAKAAANASSAVKSASSQANLDRIEEEALQVIHGDFGNNPGRAEKLGADYAAVQARVNQLLHS